MDVTYRVRWADADANQHMRHSAYADYAADVRMVLFERHGFPLERWAQMGIGPILFREETRYLRELVVGDTLRIDVKLGGLSADGRKWMLKHVFYRERDGVSEPCATLTAEGAWLDMVARKIVTAPPDLLDAVQEHFPRADDFQDPYPAPR